MKHANNKSMAFHVLQRLDYNQSLEELESDLAYELGDYFFARHEVYDKIKKLAKLNWIELNGFFDKDGN